MMRQEETISRTFSAYVQAFQTLDPRAVLPYCHVPCVFISAQGVRAMTTAAEVEAFFDQVVQGLKSRAYARSALSEFHVRQMSESAALVSVGRVRYRTDGQELERLGETYTLLRTNSGWKIAAALVHDTDTVLHPG